MITKSSMRRDWRDAIAKIQREGRCRICGSPDVEAAHVIGRKRDPVMTGPKGGEYRYVRPDAIIPLCGDFFGVGHHKAYDARELDLLPYLHLHEQVRAVEDAGGIESARMRICGASV